MGNTIGDMVARRNVIPPKKQRHIPKEGITFLRIYPDKNFDPKNENPEDLYSLGHSNSVAVRYR